MSNRDVKLSLRIHDECNGSDVFGSDICTCRPYLIFGVEEAVKEAQAGGSGVVVYFRKEGRALGEVTKYLVYNARKSNAVLVYTTVPSLTTFPCRETWFRPYVHVSNIQFVHHNHDQVQANISRERRVLRVSRYFWLRCAVINNSSAIGYEISDADAGCKSHHQSHDTSVSRLTRSNYRSCTGLG